MLQTQCLHKEKIEHTVKKIADEVEISITEEKWKQYSEEMLFQELVSCILGSKTKYEVASNCMDDLKRLNLLNPKKIISKPARIKNAIYKSLKKNKYQYPNSKAEYIVSTAIELYAKQKITLKKILILRSSDYEAREYIVKFCKGIGPKQASLFLRNIYYSDQLAILDSHVIKFMNMQGIHNNKKYPTNKSEYLKYEASLQIYANTLKKSMAQLDVAIWIVMRVAQRDMKWL